MPRRVGQNQGLDAENGKHAQAGDFGHAVAFIKCTALHHQKLVGFQFGRLPTALHVRVYSRCRPMRQLLVRNADSICHTIGRPLRPEPTREQLSAEDQSLLRITSAVPS